jgi:hypothetical protein
MSDSEKDDTDDEDYREILSPEQPLPHSFQFQALSGPKHMPPPDSPPVTFFHLFFAGLILTLMVKELNRYSQQVTSSNIVFKHPVALLYHLFHTIYFRLQCNLLFSPFLLTTCFGRTRPSSGVPNSPKLLHSMVCPTSHITCECDLK